MATQIKIRIEQATKADLYMLAEINRSSYAGEIVTRMAYPAWPDETNMRNMFSARIEDRLSQDESRFYKAVDVDSGELVGCICWTLEGDEKAVAASTANRASPTAKAMQLSTAGMNMKFVMAMGQDAEALSSHRKGTKHYYVSTFAVPPQHQGKGIGTQLLRHCMDVTDKEGLPTWLMAMPGSHKLYLRFGFTDVDYRDVDLNAWDDYRFRGYGTYRSYAMLRQPQKST